MKKLNKEEILTLQNFKNKENGPYKFFDELEKIYSGDLETIKKIKELKDMRKVVELEIDSWPAYSKSIQMYYNYMDEFLKEIGYEV